MGFGTAFGAAAGLSAMAKSAVEGNSSSGGSSSSSSSAGGANQTLEQQAVNALYENVTQQLRQTVTESKIGQVVPHLDTPAISYGHGISQKCAKLMLRSPTIPMPKLSQLETLSELHQAYSEAYPQRLDILCVILALFPLVSLKMPKEYTINIYVAPAMSCYRFSQIYSRKATQLTIGHEIIQKTLRKLLTENPLFMSLNKYALSLGEKSPKIARFIPRLHDLGCWTYGKYGTVVRWANSSITNGGPNANNMASPSKRPIEEDFHVVPKPGSETSSWMPGSGTLPEWMREFAPQNPLTSNPTDNTPIPPNALALNPDYHQITITKANLQRFFKYVGFCYTVPAFVLPAQVLFGLNCVAGRLVVGPLTPGSKVWYPFEEMVEMLPSLSSPQKDAGDMGRAKWYQQTSLISLSIAVVSCGVLGVVFGSFGKLRPK